MNEFTEYFLKALIYVLPAYLANATPVVAVKIIGRSTPLDMGLRAWDGRRILGDGKTVEGLLSGTAFGTLFGLLMFNLTEVFRSPVEPFLLSIGAMAGDVLGSFIKRRIGVERGGPMPVLDQLGFLVFSLLFSFSVYGVPHWFRADVAVALMVTTILLHLSTNYLAYVLGLKDRPY